MTTTSPMFKYFGSKVRLAKFYPPPEHRLIMDSCCGGAGYPLNFPDHEVWLNDSDQRVVRIWSYLIAVRPEQILRLPLLEPGDSVWDLDISESAKLFLSCCVNTSQFRNRLTSWKNGQNDGLWGAKWREKVASQVELIKHWKVTNLQYWQLPNLRATHFIDAPYQGLDEHYRASKQAPIDYAHLGRWARSRDGQVIVCERVGADWLPFERLGIFGAVRGKKTCEEAVWVSQDQSGSECAPPSSKQGVLFA